MQQLHWDFQYLSLPKIGLGEYNEYSPFKKIPPRYVHEAINIYHTYNLDSADKNKVNDILEEHRVYNTKILYDHNLLKQAVTLYSNYNPLTRRGVYLTLAHVFKKFEVDNLFESFSKKGMFTDAVCYRYLQILNKNIRDNFIEDDLITKDQLKLVIDSVDSDKLVTDLASREGVAKLNPDDVIMTKNVVKSIKSNLIKLFGLNSNNRYHIRSIVSAWNIVNLKPED